MPPKSKEPKVSKATPESDSELDLDENSNIMKLLKYFERSSERLYDQMTSNFEKLVDKLITKT